MLQGHKVTLSALVRKVLFEISTFRLCCIGDFRVRLTPEPKAIRGKWQHNFAAQVEPYFSSQRAKSRLAFGSDVRRTTF